MPGLVPGIYVFTWQEDVDCRDKPGNDGIGCLDEQNVPAAAARFD